MEDREKGIIESFHRMYHKKKIWTKTYWLGFPTLKYPSDLWIYQEIINEIKPDVIVECGTFKGGSALFLASMCDLVGRGRVISIDVKEFPNKPQHERITYLIGSSTSNEIVEQVKNSILQGEIVLVILDSMHFKAHVFNELKIYSQLVTKGSYIIVEDTDLNVIVKEGHIYTHDEGPMGAVMEFMKENKDFQIDKGREKFLFTASPNGYLKRIGEKTL